jgi:subtilisin-like proprotein convertase family protein
MTTNRFISSYNANMYRIFNATPNTQRIVWAIEAAVPLALGTGTYWVEWQVGGPAANFSPASTVVGTVTQPGNNALQRTLPNTWAALLDGTNVQDMPFVIDYTTAPCSGTPNPGNTLTSSATVCPGSSFTLSLQNCTAGSGVTYQWQSATSAAGPWNNITGATSATYIATQTTATYYRCNVTCGANTGTSSPVQVTMQNFLNCYCATGATSTADTEIFNVTLNSLNNSSTCATLAPGPGSIQNRYSNYRSGTGAPAAPNVFSGGNNALSVGVNTCGGSFASGVAVWIDYNQNGIFEASERAYVSANAAVGPRNEAATIAVPSSALPGITGMRVTLVETTTPNTIAACGTYTWGETEDYLVNIAPCVNAAITAAPSNASVMCSNNASFTVGTSGSVIGYAWQYRVNASSPWLAVTNGGIYSGATTATLTLTNVPSTQNGYQYRALVTGSCTATDFSTPPATLTVTPLIATVSPTAATICTGSIQALSLTNASSPTTSTFSSGAINIAIPDVATTAGINHTIPVAGIPGGAIVSNVNVRLNITHGWVSDLMIVLRAPNGQILNLSNLVTATNQSGANFTNTIISSSGTAALNTGTRPGYTGTFRADAAGAVGAFGIPGGPAGFVPTVTTWPPLYSTLNGNWTIAMYDAAQPDAGVLNNWSVEITYGAPAQGVWTSNPASPNTMFTDAAATVPYVAGSLANTIYVNPTANTTYSVVYSTPSPCTSPATNIPVTVTKIPTAATVTPAAPSICNGASTTFSITNITDGSGPYAYQWQQLPPAGSWTNITGATGATYTVTGSSAINGYKYRVLISAPPCAGTALTSSEATLSVSPNPTVTLAASDLSITPGQNTTLTATSNPAAVSYVWRLNGTVVSGVTGPTLVVSNIDNVGTYTAEATTAPPGCKGTSNAVTIVAEASDRMWIYPNPTAGSFQVRLYYKDDATEERVVSVFNSQGMLVASRQTYYLASNSPAYLRMDFDLSGLAAGTYLVRAENKTSGKVVSGFVVVHR